MSTSPAGEHEAARQTQDLRALLDSIAASRRPAEGLENVAAGVVLVDARGALTGINSAGAVLLAQEFESLKPRDWACDIRFLAADGSTPVECSGNPLTRALFGEAVAAAELCVIPPGRRQAVRLFIAAGPLRDENGELCGAALVFRPAAREDGGSIEQRLHLLIAASGKLFSSLDSGSVLPAVLGLARDVLPADGYAIWRAEEAGLEWRVISSIGLSEQFRSTVARNSVTATLADTPLVIEDAPGFPRLEQRRDAYLAEGIRSILAVPLRLPGKQSGALAFYSRGPRRFEDVEVR
ncbi:MAG TPA: GAF domain-containing protein, partial [Bryobacteraceae bacterium]|nr:GAF domain-containing protein [Bryobacteraceae bacterium]